MAKELLLDHPYCKVWQASDELLKLIPTEVPKHTAGLTQAIDVHKHSGLHWITCMSCQWHTDWEEMFTFLVVSGRSRLYISNSKKSEFDLKESYRGDLSCSLKRGCIIQIWPMLKHRIGVFGEAAMVSIDTDIEKPFFKSQEDQEAEFINELKLNYTPEVVGS